MVGNKYSLFKHLINTGCQISKQRSIFQHIRMNARQHLDIQRNGRLGIDKGFKPIHDLISIMQHNSQLSDTVISSITTCRFDIYDRIHRRFTSEESFANKVRNNHPSVTPKNKCFLNFYNRCPIENKVSVLLFTFKFMT